jgi:hypothetical protein
MVQFDAKLWGKTTARIRERRQMRGGESMRRLAKNQGVRGPRKEKSFLAQSCCGA